MPNAQRLKSMKEKHECGSSDARNHRLLMQEHACHANMPWCDEHAFVSPKTPVTFEGACQSWSRLAHGGMLVMDYAGHARPEHASHARGVMPVTNYAGHARKHASHARRGMPVTEEHALYAVGMLKA